MSDPGKPKTSNTASGLNRAYLDLAREWVLWNQPLERALRRLTEVVAASVGAQRASVWWTDERASAMKLLDLYDRSDDEHDSGHKLPFAKFPKYFAALENGRVIDAVDAHADYRTCEFSENYLKPTGIGAMLDATLRNAGRTAGVLCIEHVGGPRLWSEHEKRFAVSVADLVSQLLTYDRMRTSEERYRSYFDLSLTGLAMTSPTKGWLEMNDALCQLLGYSREQLRAMTWSELTHPDDLGADLAQFERLLRGEIDGYHLEKRFIRGDARVVHTDLSVSCQRKPDRSVEFVIALLKDISDRKQTEQAMQRSQSLLAEAQAVAHLGNWDLDLATGKATWSDEEYRLLGYEPGQIEPATDAFMRVVHPDDRDAVAAAMQKAMLAEHGGEYAIEHRIRLADGRVKNLQQKGLTTFDAAGRPLRMFGTTLDITERIEAEHALRASEQRYRALFDNAGDAVFLVVGESFADCNQAALEMFSCSREQMLGKSPARFSPLLQPDGSPSEEAARERIARAFAGSIERFEWRHQRCDGSGFDAEVTLTMFDLAGRSHLLAQVRDITQRKAAAIALQRSSAELQASNQHLRWINEASVRLHATLDELTVAREAVALVTGYLGTAMGACLLRDPRDDRFRVVAVDGYDQTKGSFRTAVYPRNALFDRASRAGGLLEIEDISEALAELPADRDRLLELGMRSLVMLVLSYRGEELGIIALNFRERLSLAPSERETLEAFGKTVSLALANARQADDLEHQAQHDSLTGLPNRAHLHLVFDKWMAGLDEGSRDTVCGALLLLDLDRFKEVNDTLGHHTGDQLLRKIGPRLQQVLTPHEALLCRLGGDEFAVLLTDVDHTARVKARADELLRVLREPFRVDGMTLSVGGSMGVALFPVHGEDSHSLLRSADVAMYGAKHAGTGIRVYEPEMDQHTPKRLALISDLDRAVSEHQLVLHYQPKLNLENGEIVGFEALVRWQHPELGLLYPGAFMDLAEMSDVINGFTVEVFDLALAEQRRWREQGLHYAVSINLSARNLLDEHCLLQLLELMAHHDAEPGSIELEITETALMTDPEGAVTLLNRVAEAGVLLSIDDYGTGYSSLAYLRRLPIYALKIDRTFVGDMLHDEQDAVIVRSTVGLAHSLDLLVVAEGVEDEATLAMLGGMECDLVQGFYLSRPLPATDLLPWLEAYSFSPPHHRY